MTTIPDQPTWDRRRFLGASAAGLAAVALAGCSLGRASSPDREADPDQGWAGSLQEPGLEKPDVTLTDMNGEPFPFREKTDGKFTILFFGYTSCPDVCPTTLNAMSNALETIGTGPGGDPMVLFIGVDTARDTPEELKSYLGRINPTFLGLTGTDSEIAKANRQMFNPPITLETPDANGDYLVGHSSKVYVFGKDNLAHRIFPGDDVRPEQWVADLPRLDQGRYK